MKRNRPNRAKPVANALPRNVERTLREARAAHQRGEIDAAIAGYQQVLASAPKSVDAHFSLGAALAKQGKASQAEKHLLLASQLATTNPRVQNAVGINLVELGRYDDAIRAFQIAVALDPSFGGAWKNLGYMLIEVGRETDAVQVLERALLVEPLLAEGWFELHRAVFDAKQPKRAIDALTRAVASDPAHPWSRFALGVMLDLAGDEGAAKQQFEALGRSTNSFAGAIDSWSYVKEKRTERTRIFTATRQTLLYAVEQASVDGLSLEFGVRFGVSTRWLAGAAQDRTLHGFDSFEGLPESWHVLPKGAYTTQGESPRVPPNVEIHVGLFDDTLPGFAASHPGPIRLLHVDCDIYSATKSIFDQLGDRVVPGTVIVFDEYLMNDHWREDEYKAFQEAVKARGWKYEYLGFGLVTRQALVKILPSG